MQYISGHQYNIPQQFRDTRIRDRGMCQCEHNTCQMCCGVSHGGTFMINGCSQQKRWNIWKPRHFAKCLAGQAFCKMPRQFAKCLVGQAVCKLPGHFAKCLAGQAFCKLPRHFAKCPSFHFACNIYIYTYIPAGSHMGPTWAAHVGPNWESPYAGSIRAPDGSHMGPVWGAQMGPSWTPMTFPSGSKVGSPDGSQFGAHLGPMWAPLGKAGWVEKIHILDCNRP